MFVKKKNNENEKIVKFFISMIINDFVLFIFAFNSIKNRQFRKKKIKSSINFRSLEINKRKKFNKNKISILFIFLF